jgi:hypothetical protein
VSSAKPFEVVIRNPSTDTVVTSPYATVAEATHWARTAHTLGLIAFVWDTEQQEPVMVLGG